MKSSVLLLLILFCVSCKDKKAATTTQNQTEVAIDNPPEWAKHVVWYEIAVERFRNGDPSNDPTAQDIVGSYPGIVPDGWAVTPWT